MPLAATFTSCCGLGSAAARQSRLPVSGKRRRSPVPLYTVLSPAASPQDNADAGHRAAANGLTQQQKLLALRLLLQVEADADDYLRPASNHSLSFGSTSLASFASSSRSPARATSQRLALRPVASSSPSHATSCASPTPMHVFDASPYKRPQPADDSGATPVRTPRPLSVQSSVDLKTLPTNMANAPVPSQTKKHKKNPFLSWSKRLVQVFQGSSNSQHNEATPTAKKNERKASSSASKATGAKVREAMDANQRLRTAVSVSNCRMGVMDTIPELYEQRGSAFNSPLAFVPLSPESHILPQSPYQKTDPTGSGQMRSFYKSKSTAAFRELPPTGQRAVPPSCNYFMLNSSSSSSSAASVSPMHSHDPVAYLYPVQRAEQSGISPNQPAMIMRDWSSCAMAAAAASRRRPATTSTVALPSHMNSRPVVNEQPTSLHSLLRAYNVPNAMQVAHRLNQQANICSVEQLAQLALAQPSQARRIVRKVSASQSEQQRLADLIYDMVHVAGGQVPVQVPRAERNKSNLTGSSTDSGVYGSDGDAPSTEEKFVGCEAYMATLGDYVQRNQIDLSTMPYSDKFGFGHVDAEWTLALAGVLRADAVACAVALDKLRLEALRKAGRIGIPQKELAEKVRSSKMSNGQIASAEVNGMRSLGRSHAQGRSSQKTVSHLGNGCASLNRHFASKTVSQPMLLNSQFLQPSISQRTVCDCRSPECARL